jgi:chromosome segregation ATPase
MPDESNQNDRLNLLDIKLALEKLIVISEERNNSFASSIVKNSSDIGEAFRELRKTEHDVTEIKETERHLAEKIVSLEHKINELAVVLTKTRENVIRSSVVCSIFSSMITAGAIKMFIGM